MNKLTQLKKASGIITVTALATLVATPAFSQDNDFDPSKVRLSAGNLPHEKQIKKPSVPLSLNHKLVRARDLRVQQANADKLDQSTSQQSVPDNVRIGADVQVGNGIENNGGEVLMGGKTSNGKTLQNN